MIWEDYASTGWRFPVLGACVFCYLKCHNLFQPDILAACYAVPGYGNALLFDGSMTNNATYGAVRAGIGPDGANVTAEKMME